MQTEPGTWRCSTREAPMRAHFSAITVVLAFAAVAAFSGAGHGQAPGVTAFEGARIIVGDGRTIENGALVMEGTKLTQVGAGASVQVPAGATRVNLAGKT